VDFYTSVFPGVRERCVMERWKLIHKERGERREVLSRAATNDYFDNRLIG